MRDWTLTGSPAEWAALIVLVAALAAAAAALGYVCGVLRPGGRHRGGPLPGPQLTRGQIAVMIGALMTRDPYGHPRDMTEEEEALLNYLMTMPDIDDVPPFSGPGDDDDDDQADDDDEPGPRALTHPAGLKFCTDRQCVGYDTPHAGPHEHAPDGADVAAWLRGLREAAGVTREAAERRLAGWWDAAVFLQRDYPAVRL